MTSLAALPAFLAYIALCLGLLAAFLAAYTALTPYPNWTLIRAGNTAAALSLSGAIIGFCLPLASLVSHSVGLLDVLVWGVAALALALLRLMHTEIWAAVARGDMAAVMGAAGSLAVDILDAACLSY